MRFLSRYNFIGILTRRCGKETSNSGINITKIRSFMTINPNKRIAIRNPPIFASAVCVYSSDNKKHFLNFDKKTEALKDVIEHKKEQLKDTEQRIRLRGEAIVRDIKQHKEITGQKLREKKEHLIKDILETKAKVKEKLEVVVEDDAMMSSLALLSWTPSRRRLSRPRPEDDLLMGSKLVGRPDSITITIAVSTVAFSNMCLIIQKENPFTIPNVLCMARIVMSPYLGYVILQDNYTLALGLVTFAGITDLLDGWIARNWEGQSSKMGSFLDPLADKVLIATLFISLTWQNLIPLNLTLLIVGRDIALVASAFVIRYMSLPPPRTLSRYFDVTHATAQLAPTFISKVNTAVQLLLVGTTLASPVFGYVDHPALHALCAVTAGSTVVSAISYLVSKDTYKFLKKS